MGLSTSSFETSILGRSRLDGHKRYRRKQDLLRCKRDNMNWLRRQHSDQMNRDQESIHNRVTVAVAAAAFAIHSHEESEIPKNGKGTKKEDATSKLARSREVTKQISYKKANSAGDTAPMRQPTTRYRESMERAYSPRKPSRSSSENARENGKVERNDKLKSILAWANAKKMKGKHKLQQEKD